MNPNIFERLSIVRNRTFTLAEYLHPKDSVVQTEIDIRPPKWHLILNGGSYVTPHHFRPTYRNFFHSPLRWQSTGIRLSKNF